MRPLTNEVKITFLSSTFESRMCIDQPTNTELYISNQAKQYLRPLGSEDIPDSHITYV